jgi:hypothetical protein
MRRFRPTAISGSEITPESSYLQRRDILRLGAAGGLAGSSGCPFPRLRCRPRAACSRTGRIRPR